MGSALQRAENSSPTRRASAQARAGMGSALQRAENSSLRTRCDLDKRAKMGSALQRAENSSQQALDGTPLPVAMGSALQRAENSSVRDPRHLRQTVGSRWAVLFSEPKIPPRYTTSVIIIYARDGQCSSASRKFLSCNATISYVLAQRDGQCSSASRKFLNSSCNSRSPGSTAWAVLFSEPKIPRDARSRTRLASLAWAVLFSEPKIPPSGARATARAGGAWAVLFSEPKIPPSCAAAASASVACVGSALQRAENSSISPRTCVHPYSRLRRSRFVVPEPSWCVAMTPVY